MQSAVGRAKTLVHLKDAAKVYALKKLMKEKQPTDVNKVLTTLLKRTDAVEVWNALSRAPSRLDDKQGEALLQALEVLGLSVEEARKIALDPNPKEVHCTRCHERFMERDNCDGACVVKHDGDSESTEDDDGMWRETCTSCGWMSRPYDRCPTMPQICYEGMHTTEEYCAEEGTTIKPCDELGCSVDDSSEDEDENEEDMGDDEDE